MDTYAFGKLVRALRREHMNEDGVPWTQADLARQTPFSRKVICDIERGERGLDEDVCIRLADALMLTTMERHAFFHAARDITSQAWFPGPQDNYELCDLLIERLESVHLPGFLCDHFTDIVAVNTCMLTFLGITPSYVVQAQTQPAGYTVIRSVFDPRSPLQTVLGHHWHRMAVQNIQFFRGVTLPYRHLPSFHPLLAELRTYPHFRRYWSFAHKEVDYTRYPQTYTYAHPIHGPVTYGVQLTRTPTPVGELYTTFYLPVSAQTRMLFDTLCRHHGNMAQRLARWPT